MTIVVETNRENFENYDKLGTRN